jgi:hypothetical protein
LSLAAALQGGAVGGSWRNDWSLSLAAFHPPKHACACDSAYELPESNVNVPLAAPCKAITHCSKSSEYALLLVEIVTKGQYLLTSSPSQRHSTGIALTRCPPPRIAVIEQSFTINNLILHMALKTQ